MHIPDKKILIAYFAGTLPADAVAEAEAFIAANEDPELVRECMEEAWEMTAGVSPLPAPEQAAAWNRFVLHTSIITTPRKVHRLTWTKVAAASLVAVIISAAAILFFPATKTAPLSWMKVTAVPQVLKKVQLPDGSSVTLFPGATLQYSSLFNLRERKVFLHGRAYFDISTSPGKPFSVHTGQYSTQVLGTKFEINEQAAAHHLAVVLQSGKVQVCRQNQSLTVLQPDESIIVQTDNGSFQKEKVPAVTMLTWLSGELTYEQATLSEVCTDLERWYGVHIHIGPQRLHNKHITGSFSRMPLQAVMNILSQTAGFRYNIQQQQVNIY